MLKERLLGIVLAMAINLLLNSQAIAQLSLGLPWRAGQVWTVIQGYHSSIGGAKSIDFDAEYGAQVVASADGTAYARESISNAYTPCARNEPGFVWRSPLKYVEIYHGDDWKTTYLHLSGFASNLPLNTGVSVKKGTLIGYLGNSGWINGVR